MLYKYVWTVLACLLFHLTLLAQTKYDLHQILEKALANYPSLKEKQAKIEGVEISQELLRFDKVPEINFQLQNNYGYNPHGPGSFFSLPGNYNTGSKGLNGKEPAYASFNSSVMVKWNALQFGKFSSKKRRLLKVGKQIKSEYDRESYYITQAVITEYFQLLGQYAHLRISKKEESILNELYELSIALANDGLRPGADTLLIKSSVLDINNTVRSYEAKSLKSKLKLASFIGEAPDFAIDTSVFFTDQFPSLSDPQFKEHPAIQYDRTGIELEKANLNVAAKEAMPTVGVLAASALKGSGISTNHPASGLGVPFENINPGYLFGVFMTWNFTDILKTPYKRRISLKDVEAAKARLEQTELDLATSAQISLRNIGARIQNVRDAREALSKSKEAFDLFYTRYENGLINLIELLQLQQSLQLVSRNYISSLQDYWQEIIAYAQSTGNFSPLFELIDNNQNNDTP